MTHPDCLHPHRVLVTGASGFAGRHLTALLLTETVWSVVGVSRQPQPAGDDKRLTWRQADVRDLSQMFTLVQAVQPSIVFHLAGAAPPAADVDLLATNVLGAVNLLEAVLTQSPAPTILLVGSDAQYGPHAPLPTTEATPLRPLHTYGRSKVLQEAIGQSYAVMRGLRVVCARPFNHIGPGQSERFVVAVIARQIALAEAGRGPGHIQLGRTDTSRDFTDGRDVVRAYLACVLHGEAGAVYNIGSGRSWRIGEVADRLVALARVPITVETTIERVRAAEVLETQCDFSRLHRLTGWTPRIPIEQTLYDTLDYWRRRINV